MAMNRRHFVKAVLAAPLIWVAERVGPARYVEALRARFYPGTVAPLDKSEVAKVGKWAG